MKHGTPKHFASPAELRAWFTAHHESREEFWIGFHKRHTGKPSITWPESVDEALCVGWIDGIRKSLGEASYRIRFTPRKKRSVWSAVNIRRVKELKRLGRMRPAGLTAYAAREERRSGIYAYEQRSESMPDPYAKIFKKEKAAWRFFQRMPPWYRKTVNWWIVSAKKEETRMRRLATLIELCAAEKKLPQLTRYASNKK